MNQRKYGLYVEHNITNLSSSLKEVNNEGYDLIANPIMSGQRNLNDKVILDPIVESDEHKIISILSDYIDCDSSYETYRKYSETILKQELSLVQKGIVLIKLKNSSTINLARVISRDIKRKILVEIPMFNPKRLSNQSFNSTTKKIEKQYEDPWEWWNSFRWYTEFSTSIFVALELSDIQPSHEELLRWLGEPVSVVIIPSHLFIINNQNCLVLSTALQFVVSKFIKMNVDFLVKCNTEDKRRQDYVKHLKELTFLHLSDNYNIIDSRADILEIPSQPLTIDLDSFSYDVFENDPMKYVYYQIAIELAMIDKVPTSQIERKKLTVMVAGAGRGLLIRAVLNAATNSNRKVKIIAVEKNQESINHLMNLVDSLWADKDIEIISADMREFTPSEKVDILVSELLGSFGDNELSPECLDGAQKHLKCGGISIPYKTTSYINPIMSSKLYNSMRTFEKRTSSRNSCPKNCDGQSESMYVTCIKNAYHIDRPQPLFQFVHPNRSVRITDNERFKTLLFKASIDCILHGFAGYFDAALYKEITLSTHPVTHSTTTWLSMFFPLNEPIQLKTDDTIEVSFWRCVSTKQVWYEWNVSLPIKTHLHNHNGRHCAIIL